MRRRTRIERPPIRRPDGGHCVGVSPTHMPQRAVRPPSGSTTAPSPRTHRLTAKSLTAILATGAVATRLTPSPQARWAHGHTRHRDGRAGSPHRAAPLSGAQPSDAAGGCSSGTLARSRPDVTYPRRMRPARGEGRGGSILAWRGGRGACAPTPLPIRLPALPPPPPAPPPGAPLRQIGQILTPFDEPDREIFASRFDFL